MPVIQNETAFTFDLELKRLYAEYCRELASIKIYKKGLSKKYYSKFLSDQIDAYCTLCNIDQHHTGFIIVHPEKNDRYNFFLSISLVFFPLYNITAYLDYQLEKFKGGKVYFIEMVMHSIVPHTKANSPFDNSARLDRIMEWANNKKYKKIVRKDNSFTNADIKIIWLPPDKKKLKDLSHRLFESEYTQRSSSFESVFTQNKYTIWKRHPEYILYLLDRLIKNKTIKAQHGKGHLKSAIRYFFGEDSEILAKKNKAHHLLSRINIKDRENFASTREKVDTLLLEILNF